jgi:hypothetical protein
MDVQGPKTHVVPSVPGGDRTADLLVRSQATIRALRLDPPRPARSDERRDAGGGKGEESQAVLGLLAQPPQRRQGEASLIVVAPRRKVVNGAQLLA